MMNDYQESCCFANYPFFEGKVHARSSKVFGKKKKMDCNWNDGSSIGEDFDLNDINYQRYRILCCGILSHYKIHIQETKVE